MLKHIVIQIKSQSKEWGKIFSTLTSTSRLIPKIYKEQTKKFRYQENKQSHLKMRYESKQRFET